MQVLELLHSLAEEAAALDITPLEQQVAARVAAAEAGHTL